MRGEYFFWRLITIFIIGQMVFLPLAPVLAEEVVEAQKEIVAEEGEAPLKIEPKNLHYNILMRKVGDLKKNKIGDQTQTLAELNAFIEQEKVKLDKLGVSEEKQERYFNILNKQLTLTEENPEKTEIKIPTKPASFKFNDEAVQVQSLPERAEAEKKKIKLLGWWEDGLISYATALEDQYLPVLADMQSDGGEVIINSEIRDLARQLDNNPVKIFNFVRQSIVYEPYYGAKKGSTGCLRERVCNDVDTSSLLVALLRAAGIPARYKKSMAVMTVGQIKNLLGVEDIKTAYALWYWNKVPVHVLSDLDVSGGFEDMDFSQETHLAVEWVFVEAFYDYDARGGNINNTVDFFTASSTEALRASLQAEGDYKKQWIPIDAVVKPYIHTQKAIVADTANFDTQVFWTSYLQYQGNLSPAEKYRADLLNATGKDITAPDYQSVKSFSAKDFDVLPPTLPYYTRTGEVGGSFIQPEAWSVPPDSRRYQVRISLLKSADQSTVWEHVFYGSEINNAGLDFYYEGATDQDKQVIESYGGLAATPAALVDIRPYIQSGTAKYEANTILKIGDSLIMQFEYLLNNAVLYTDQKFSVAGNQEGVYISLSQAPANPDWDNNSKILLGGNAALAQSYLARIKEKGDLFKKALDYEYTINFSRAVVTQNRVLSMVDGLPTTFDFQGLTIDASIFINDWSNRNLYNTHRKDFRLLWGLAASHDEGQLFTDIAGLEGISTVKGLQYAYAHPETYAVQTIATANEGVIDGLQLSDNTKANLHTEVQQGNTVITPDKNVAKGNWNGILYISLKPDWTALYGIGEQVQNGGWTVASFDNVEVGRFKNEGATDYFIYADDSANSKGKICRIAKQEFTDIMNNEGWQASYGLPCLVEHHNFGNDPNDDHTMILTLDAAKFKSQRWGYNEWKAEKDIVNLMKQKLPVESIGQQNVYVYWGTYTFAKCNPNWDKQGKIRLLLAYNPRDSQVYSVSNYDIVQKYISADKIVDAYAPSLLGYPTSDTLTAAQSFADSTGQYNNFINGQIYFKDNTWPRPNQTTVVFGKIAEYYNSGENMRNGQRGSGGVLGFAVSDPYQTEGTSDVLQKFENKMLKLSSDTFSLVGYDDHERRMNNRMYAMVVLNKVITGDITDGEAFARLADNIAYVSDDNKMFVHDLTMLLAGVEKVWNKVGRERIEKGEQSEYQWGNDYKTGETFSDTGFKFEYNDSHYQQSCRGPAQEHYYSSNQLFHAMLGFSVGYSFPDPTAVLATIYHDWAVSPLGIKGNSLEDRKLGYRIGDLGQALRLYILKKEEVGNWIRDNLLDEVNSPSKLKTILEQECNIRKHFRVFEKDTFGDVKGKWGYNQDMQYDRIRDVYYQFYTKFGNKENVTAIWDVQKQQVVLNNY